MSKESYVPQYRIKDLDVTLATKANDTAVVHKASDETITGTML